MLGYVCMSDMGSVLIGDETWTFAIPNEGGDGETKIFVFEDPAEFHKSNVRSDVKFLSSVQGTFGVYDYDCSYHRLHNGELSINDAMVVLNGRYGVYYGEYKVVFVRWGDSETA